MAWNDISDIPWLNAGEPAGAPMLRGVQAGTAIAATRQRGQAMAEERRQFDIRSAHQMAEMVLREKDQEMQTQFKSVELAGKWMKNIEEKLGLEDTMKIREAQSIYQTTGKLVSPMLSTPGAQTVWKNFEANTILGKSIAEENDQFNKALGELPIGKNEVLRLRGEGPTPSAESWGKLNEMLEVQAAKKLEKATPTLTPGKVGDRDVVISPGGAVHYTDNFSPVDKAELGNLNKTLLDIDREARKLASEPDPERARALNAQRFDAEAKKEALVSKYSSSAKPPKSEPTSKPISEVIRATGDGRNAVFDSETKKFIRYAD